MSSGPDSSALAHMLSRWCRDSGVRVEAIHFIHPWPETGEWEKRWALALSSDFHLTLHIGSWKDIHHGEDPGDIMSETYLRKLRLKFFIKKARELGADSIALGHHADDQVETFLHRLMRGTGPHGLVGMRKIQYFQNIRFIRPLLDIRKKDIERYLVTYGIVPFRDPTNADIRILRNWIRHRLLPALRTREPHIDERILRLRTFLEDDQIYLNRKALQASKKYEIKERVWKRKPFLKMPRPIQTRWIRIILKQYGLKQPPSSRVIEDILHFICSGFEHGTYQVKKHLIIWKDRTCFGLGHHSPETPPEKPQNWSGEGLYVFNTSGLTLRFARIKPPSNFSPRTSHALRKRKFFLCADCVEPPGVLRNRKRGDRFHPLGMKQDIRLSRFFIQRKVPYYERKYAILLETHKGIACVFPYEIAEWAKVTTHSTYIWEVNIGYIKSFIHS